MSWSVSADQGEREATLSALHHALRPTQGYLLCHPTSTSSSQPTTRVARWNSACWMSMVCSLPTGRRSSRAYRKIKRPFPPRRVHPVPRYRTLSPSRAWLPQRTVACWLGSGGTLAQPACARRRRVLREGGCWTADAAEGVRPLPPAPAGCGTADFFGVPPLACARARPFHTTLLQGASCLRPLPRPPCTDHDDFLSYFLWCTYEQIYNTVSTMAPLEQTPRPS